MTSGVQGIDLTTNGKAQVRSGALLAANHWLDIRENVNSRGESSAENHTEMQGKPWAELSPDVPKLIINLLKRHLPVGHFISCWSLYIE
jgi:hypothetical protein